MACTERPPFAAEVQDDGVALWQSDEERRDCVGLLWRDVARLRRALDEAEAAHRARLEIEGGIG